MTGVEDYNKKWEERALYLIKDNREISCLRGFYYYALTNMSYSSAYTYSANIVKFIKDMDISNVKRIKMDSYTMYMAMIKNKSSSYQIEVYSSLKKFSKYLKANGLCEDYMQFVSRPKFKETQKTKEKRENGFLTKEEAKSLIRKAYVKNDNYNKSLAWQVRDAVIASIFINTGIRSAELYKLDVQDVNLEDRELRVVAKGGVYREVYINEKTAILINEWLEYRKEILGDKKENALIISKRKQRATQPTIHHIIKTLGENIEGKNITPHKLRATYGTGLYAETGDLYFVQECMGHSNPKTTEIYIRGQKKEASQKAADLMSGFLE